MYRHLLAGIFLFTCLNATAQKTQPVVPPSLPVDSITKKITYEKVVEVKNASAGQLYSRINDWFKSYYKNPTEVIRENDSTKFRIVGKPRFRMSNPTVGKDEQVQYTITVAARDGRFKYELTDFNWKQISYYACEHWIDTKAAGYSPAYNEYLLNLDKTANEVIGALINAATHEKAVKDKDNW